MSAAHEGWVPDVDGGEEDDGKKIRWLGLGKETGMRDLKEHLVAFHPEIIRSGDRFGNQLTSAAIPESGFAHKSISQAQVKPSASDELKRANNAGFRQSDTKTVPNSRKEAGEETTKGRRIETH